MKWDAIANSLARVAKIPGYRPGKAPRSVIEKTASPGLVRLAIQGDSTNAGRIFTENAGSHPPHLYMSSWPSWPLLMRPIWFQFDKLADDRFQAIVFHGNPLILWPALVALGICLRDWIVRRRADAFLILAFYVGPWMAWAALPRTIGVMPSPNRHRPSGETGPKPSVRARSIMRSRLAAIVRPSNAPGPPISFFSTNIPRCKPIKFKALFAPVKSVFALASNTMPINCSRTQD